MIAISSKLRVLLIAALSINHFLSEPIYDTVRNGYDKGGDSKICLIISTRDFVREWSNFSAGSWLIS